MGGRGGGSKMKRGGGGPKGVAVKGETSTMRISEMDLDQLSKERVRLEETQRRASAGRSNKAGEPYAFTNSDATRLSKVTEALDAGWAKKNAEDRATRYNRLQYRWNHK